MITDSQLYSLAIFLGAAAMLMIVLYHFLEVNAQDDDSTAGSLDSNNNTTTTNKLANEKTGVGAVKPALVDPSHSRTPSSAE
ncbi:hypothetical protein PV05_00748 [Exophiala xenobiotica]|jgi:oligosaccharyl transferase complex subunit OST4|uniref:Dolichyl-diphosphooligosaccharide--protein glycosyltransferase subunit 4 n=1 Tax=Exophiala xenobiotica TaxID=348802 RepID=A0A0D2FK86_9EURO|nr:uncharacterized protein PV05_00748 [Exophiala xenobiotica]KIW60539.1 hypothetical protein PV05_00748 [Exophiala xenobiotica]